MPRKYLQTRHFFIIISLLLCVTTLTVFSVTPTHAQSHGSAGRILLVDFGTTASENQFGFPEWNTVIKSSNTKYTDAGPGGLMKLSGSHKLDNYQGIIGPSTTFEAGDEIIVTWYNNTGQMVSLWSPLISFEDTDNPDAAPGEPQWHVMKAVGGGRTIDYMQPEETRQSIYVVTSPETIVGTAVPVQGQHRSINISVNSAKTGIVCDKIELVRAVDSRPSKPLNLVAVPYPDAPDSRIDLTWSTSRGEVDHYRIYRNGLWVDKTPHSYYTDSNLEHSTEYTYTVRAFRNIENKSEPSREVRVRTRAFQGRSSLIDPQKDLEYVGAFRFPPVGSTPGSQWNYRFGDIVYYAPGDPNNIDGDTDFPGSLYAFGYRKDGKVAEMSIPTPVNSKNVHDLPESQTLQSFHEVRASNTPGSSDLGAPGLAYIPSKDTFYYTFNDNFNVSYKKKLSHGSFKPDFSDIQGLWWIGEKNDLYHPPYYAYSKFMSTIPQDWAAAAGIPGELLLSGGARAGGTPMGPGLIAVQPWNDDGSIPYLGAELKFTTLLQYNIHTTGGGAHTLNGWIENDGWAGVSWLKTGNQSAVVITGEKAYGEYYYGYLDGSAAFELLHAVPKIHARTSGGKGGCARSYKGMMLFYDPADLAEVAKGHLEPSQPQPYAVLEIDKYLLRTNSGGPTMENWLGSATFDKDRGLLYVVERDVYNEKGPADVIHIFRVGRPVYTITATAGSHGKIFPADAVTIHQGDTQSFSILPDAGYQVEDVLVDGVSQGSIKTYTFTDVQADHTIIARFKALVTASYFGFDEFGGSWHDAGLVQSDRLTWAAAAANILAWSSWDAPIHKTAQEILENFEGHWTDEPGLMSYGWQWWFNGAEPTEMESASQVHTPGGNYWSRDNFFDYFYEDWADFSEGQWGDGSQLMPTIAEYLHNGYGVTLDTDGDGAHELTAWGYESDEFGNYTGVWVTDSSDALHEMILLSADLVDGLWYLDPTNQYGYKGWAITGVQALDRKPVPEPGTFFLINMGLAGVIAHRRRISKRA